MYFQTSIKIPTELYEKIKIEASEQERNVTGEIVWILKQYFKENNQ